jgi:N-methylhydantoinase A/oxoprolinase/acetone carboxylase beta subunit
MEKSLIAFLRDGPQPLPEILKHLNLLHAAQIGARELLRQEIIGRSGLTPTDLLHVEGRFDPWDAEAASLALGVFSRVQFRDLEELRQQVWSRMTETIVQSIVTFLSGKALPPPALPYDRDMGRWFFYNSLYSTHPQLETRFHLRQPIIGIGAPASVFLKDVADAFHTDLVLPEHHPVANAVGAIAGSVMVTEEILVYPRLSREGLEVMGYYVQASDERREFEVVSDALAHARALGQERALGAALRSGADNPQVVLEELSDGLDTYRIRAKAVGNPRLAR